jgi:hypothetical protein
MAPSYALATRKGAAKRWQGYVQAGLLSRENISSGVPTLLVLWKATSPAALCASRRRTRAVEEPWHVRKLHAREPGGPMFARPVDHGPGRSGNAQAVRLR